MYSLLFILLWYHQTLGVCSNCFHLLLSYSKKKNPCFTSGQLLIWSSQLQKSLDCKWHMSTDELLLPRSLQFIHIMQFLVTSVITWILRMFRRELHSIEATPSLNSRVSLSKKEHKEMWGATPCHTMLSHRLPLHRVYTLFNFKMSNRKNRPLTPWIILLLM